MKSLKGFVMMLFALCTAFSSGMVSFAEEAAALITDYENGLPEVIHRYIKAMEEHDWSAYMDTFSPQIQGYYDGPPSQEMIDDLVLP